MPDAGSRWGLTETFLQELSYRTALSARRVFMGGFEAWSLGRPGAGFGVAWASRLSDLGHPRCLQLVFYLFEKHFRDYRIVDASNF